MLCDHRRCSARESPVTARVLVTRDEPREGALSRALSGAGLEPVWCPVIERRIVADILPMLAPLRPDDWLVLTSPFAIESIPADMVRCRVAVVGAASTAAARARGWSVERVSPDGTGQGLWSSLRKDAAGARRICYPRSSVAPEPGAIAGVELTSPILYQALPRPFQPELVQRADVVTLASPSAVERVFAIRNLPRAAAIGPTTAAALRSHGIDPWVECGPSSFAEFAQEIARCLAPRL
jgi:uroporphyrinogen-III synthase